MSWHASTMGPFVTWRGWHDYEIFRTGVSYRTELTTDYFAIYLLHPRSLDASLRATEVRWSRRYTTVEATVENDGFIQGRRMQESVEVVS